MNQFVRELVVILVKKESNNIFRVYLKKITIY